MCTSAAPNDCSLRGAINRVNTDVVVNATIRFSSTVSQINLTSALPSLTTTGTNIKGVNGPRVSGAAMASGSMMTIDSSQAVIEGLSFINGDIRDISVMSGSGNVIRRCTIGTPNGSVSACVSAGVTRTSLVGIFVGPAVTGDSAAPSPLFRHLTAALPGVLGSEAVKWNFTKFLVDRAGRPVSRHAPTTAPAALAAEIEALL